MGGDGSVWWEHHHQYDHRICAGCIKCLWCGSIKSEYLKLSPHTRQDTKAQMCAHIFIHIKFLCEWSQNKEHKYIWRQRGSFIITYIYYLHHFCIAYDIIYT